MGSDCLFCFHIMLTSIITKLFQYYFSSHTMYSTNRIKQTLHHNISAQSFGTFFPWKGPVIKPKHHDVESAWCCLYFVWLEKIILNSLCYNTVQHHTGAKKAVWSHILHVYLFPWGEVFEQIPGWKENNFATFHKNMYWSTCSYQI